VFYDRKKKLFLELIKFQVCHSSIFSLSQNNNNSIDGPAHNGENNFVCVRTLSSLDEVTRVFGEKEGEGSCNQREGTFKVGVGWECVGMVLVAGSCSVIYYFSVIEYLLR
jgi:hypothetical protein